MAIPIRMMQPTITQVCETPTRIAAIANPMMSTMNPIRYVLNEDMDDSGFQMGPHRSESTKGTRLVGRGARDCGLGEKSLDSSAKCVDNDGQHHEDDEEHDKKADERDVLPQA